MNKIITDTQAYIRLLTKYLESNDPFFLDQAKKWSSSFVSQNIYPEEMIKIHMEAIEVLCNDVPSDYKRSLEFLYEALFAYRVAHEEYEQLKEEQLELKSEIQVAANMQQTLLATKIPKLKDIDIGATTVPLHQMNGDYYHFVEGEDGMIGVAIADVIGKGVPAALSMSMIKYAMDSFYEDEMSPKSILRNLNRVVERNVAPNMFITMFYGQFYPQSSMFRYASAGHEPGFFYKASEKKFVEIEAKGLVLGVVKDTMYKEYEVRIEKGDMIILLTDGVTECRRGDRFINRDEVIEVIQHYAHLPAQKHVEKVYHHFHQLDDFELKDDFTLIIIKK